MQTNFREVATTLNRDGTAVRQLAVRARKHVQDARPRYPVNRAEGDRIATAFFAAAQNGDTVSLQKLLSSEVVLAADGGGKVLAFRNPICGVARVLRLYAGLYRKFLAEPPVTMVPAWINGLPGYISRERAGVLQTTAFAIEAGVITRIYITRNPEKLAGVEQRYEGRQEL